MTGTFRQRSRGFQFVEGCFNTGGFGPAIAREPGQARFGVMHRHPIDEFLLCRVQEHEPRDFRGVEAGENAVLAAFASSGQLSGNDTASRPTPASEAPVLAVSFDLGKVGTTPISRRLIYVYDDLYSIQYFKKNLRPYWRKGGWEAADLIKASATQYEGLDKPRQGVRRRTDR
jgi:hypothetical protein